VAQLGSATTLNGGPLKIFAHVYWQTTTMVWDPETETNVPHTTSGNYWEEIDLSVAKLNLETISLDSRKVFGKANLDGELPGDPNAELSTNNFQPWLWKGGHFVGNMPYGSSHDQSGTARTQLRLVGGLPTSDYVASCVTLFDTGTAGATSTGTIGLYRPNVEVPGTNFVNDPKLNEGINVNWGNKWTLAPGTGSLPPNQTDPIDFTAYPVYSITPAAGDVNNYLNWQLPYRSAITQLRYRGNGIYTDVANNFWKHVSLCQNNELDKTWQYFSSEWTQAVPNQVFPLSDSRPRLWWVGIPGAQ
jgi:hypothetical protein